MRIRLLITVCVLGILLALLGCEKRVLSNEDRARNHLVGWVKENRLKGDFPSMCWMVEKNRGQHENKWECEYVFLHERRGKAEGGNSHSSFKRIDWISEKKEWGAWTVLGPIKSEHNGLRFEIKCPFAPTMHWAIDVVEDQGEFRVVDAMMWHYNPGEFKYIDRDNADGG